MTKSEFKELLHRYTKSTQKEAEQVILLEKEYPYSQILHSLAARLSKDHSLPAHQEELQLAAVYSADRHVLKLIMTGELETNTTSDNAVNTDGHSSDEEYHDYADEVVHDLERLHELKHNFEMLYDEQTKRNNAGQQKTASTKVQTREIKKAKSKTKEPVKSKAGKGPVNTARVVKSSKKVKLKAKKTLAKTAKAVPAKKKLKPKHQKKSLQPKKETLNDDILQEIEATKRKLKPESSKQKEQIQLIDQFIKAQPSISSLRDRAASAPQGDLASYKQGEFGDQIISETLVGILIRQGKKEKAIEVLKKLIWKFPQKKAYFAAQIEELKK